MLLVQQVVGQVIARIFGLATKINKKIKRMTSKETKITRKLGNPPELEQSYMHKCIYGSHLPGGIFLKKIVIFF